MVKNMKYTKAKLPNICTIKTGKHDANHANKEGKYRFYTCSNQYSKCDTYSFTGESVIVPGNGDIGLVFYYDGEFDAYQRTYVLNDIKILPKYLFYHMQLYWRNFNDQKKFGSTVKYVRMSNFTNYEISYPSIEKQQCIVAKIEELFSELDNAVETLNATKTQLEVYRQAVLKEAFVGKLTAKWRERNNIDYSFNKVNIKALVKKEKNSLKAGPFGSSLKKEFYVSNGYKIYGQEQVIAGDECIGDYYVNEEKYQELITCKVSPRDVLISLVGTVGKVLILSRECKAGLINPRLIKISLDENIMIPEYFKYYFESDFIKTLYKSKVHGATMDVLNMSMIKELPFLLCSIKEQEQIIYEIESRMSEYYNIENTVNMVLQQTSAMRQSILKQAFEGRLL